MDISKLKRNPKKIISTIFETEHQLFVKEKCFVTFPASYVNKGLATFGSEVSVLGVYAIVNGNDYGVSRSTSMVNLTPSSIETFMDDDKEHYLLTFEAGSMMMKNTLLVKNKKIVNTIMDYFIDYGHSPWFISYIDHAELFIYSGYFNDLKLGLSQAVMDVITAQISRDPKDFEQLYRHTIKNAEQIHQRPTFVATRDIAINTNSNLARLNGSELQRSIKASMLSRPERAEPLEQHFLN